MTLTGSAPPYLVLGELSLIFEGVRWNVAPPRQIRVRRNVASFKPRVRRVSDATLKLSQAGLFEFLPLRTAHQPILPSTSPHLLQIPQYLVGVGGTDKPDSTQVRKVCDTSAPHQIVRERNTPHGQPDGPVTVNFNDLTGPIPAPLG